MDVLCCVYCMHRIIFEFVYTKLKVRYEHGISARQEDDALDAQLDDDEAAIAGVLLEVE